MKLATFIDYDNLLDRHKSSGILDVVTKALFQTPLSSQNVRGTCDIRIYGGWYEGLTMTGRAQELTGNIGDEFPTIIRVATKSGEVLALETTAALAVATMEEPGHHLFGTYREKGKPRNIRVKTPAAVGCTDPSCLLPMTKKLLEFGSCSVPSCAVTSNDLVYRQEQKIVDTMLTCDMVYAPTQDYQHLVLISGDEDFVPPLRTVLLRGTPVARFHPQPNSSRTPLVIPGRQLTDMDL